MRLLLPIAFHLLPILPLIDGRIYGAIAAVLLVALPYIKAMKMKYDIEFHERKRTGLIDTRLEREIEGLKTSRRRWLALTFLPWLKPEAAA